MSTTNSDQNPSPATARTLSHSQMETWDQCPRRWYLTKVVRMPQAPSEHLALGTALHAALEADGRRKLDGHAEGWLLAKLWGIFSDALHRELQIRDPLGLLDHRTRNELSLRGAAMLRAYTKHVQPSFHPIAVEEEITADVPGVGDAPPIRFTGRLDAITGDAAVGMGGTRTIVDFKTAGRPWGLGIEHSKSQATAYLWLDRERLDGADADAIQRHRVTFVVLATEPTGGGSDSSGYSCVVQSRPTTRSASEIAGFVASTRGVARQMAAIGGEDDAVAHTGPLCGWCPVLGHCAAGQAWLKLYGRRPMVPVITAEMAAEMAAPARVEIAAEVEP